MTGNRGCVCVCVCVFRVYRGDISRGKRGGGVTSQVPTRCDAEAFLEGGRVGRGFEKERREADHCGRHSHTHTRQRQPHHTSSIAAVQTAVHECRSRKQSINVH